MAAYSATKCTATVFPAPHFNALEDAEALKKAMKGFGCDGKAIVGIVTNRGIVQRIEIAETYKTQFGKDLIEDLKGELSGDLKKLIIGLMTPLQNYYAAELHDAMAGIGTTNSTLVEILCTLSNYGIKVISETYQKLYGKTLESDIIGDTSGHFQRILVTLCQGNRETDQNVDPELAKREADELHQAGEKIVGTEESVFNRIIGTRSYAQLKRTFAEYEKLTGHEIEVAIKKEFSGNIQECLLSIVACVRNKFDYFAERLHKSMKGIGTDDATLIRIIVSRCEIDLGDIKRVFLYRYGESLEKWIEGDTSGHYKDALISLVS